jgi:putative restriction endonuclease
MLAPRGVSDLAIREAAIRHCRALSARWGEAVPYAELQRGLPFETAWIKLTGPQGVFKPKELRDGPLTLLSTLASTYADEDVDGDIVLYDYAPSQREYENDGLKRVAALGRTVILLKQVKAKPSPEYMVFAPVVMLAFDDVARKVRLDLGAASQQLPDAEAAPMPAQFSRAYAETLVRARLHQAHFRRHVLDVYRSRCCVCVLAERPLLDAAHIVDDRLPEGIAAIRNGLAMCPTHHRAYDRGILLVHENYRTEIRRDRLVASEAPPTRQMLLEYSGREIHRPRNEAHWPDPVLLRRKLELIA